MKLYYIMQSVVTCMCFPSALSPYQKKFKIHFEFLLLFQGVDLYSVASDNKAEKKRAQSSNLFHKQALCHQYCRGIHTAGLED